MQILTVERGFEEVPDELVVQKYASYMLMPMERAQNFFRVVMQGRQPFPVQGLGFVIPTGLSDNLETLAWQILRLGVIYWYEGAREAPTTPQLEAMIKREVEKALKLVAR